MVTQVSKSPGKIKARHPWQEMKIVFLDRDGVINFNRLDYIKSVKGLKIIDGVFEAIKKLNNANFKVVVISKQCAVTVCIFEQGNYKEGILIVNDSPANGDLI